RLLGHVQLHGRSIRDGARRIDFTVRSRCRRAAAARGQAPDDGRVRRPLGALAVNRRRRATYVAYLRNAVTIATVSLTGDIYVLAPEQVERRATRRPDTLPSPVEGP